MVTAAANCSDVVRERSGRGMGANCARAHDPLGQGSARRPATQAASRSTAVGGAARPDHVPTMAMVGPRR